MKRFFKISLSQVSPVHLSCVEWSAVRPKPVMTRQALGRLYGCSSSSLRLLEVTNLFLMVAGGSVLCDTSCFGGRARADVCRSLELIVTCLIVIPPILEYQAHSYGCRETFSLSQVPPVHLF